MNAGYLVAFATICGIASATAIFNNGRTFFKHRDQPIERRSPIISEDAQSLQDLTSRWFKHYYHENNGDAEPSEQQSKYKYVSPANLQWLMDNILETAQDPKAFSPVQDSMSPLKTNGPQTPVLADENDSDAPEYTDIYGIASVLTGQEPPDSSFQQALANYLMQSSPQEDHAPKSGKVEPADASMRQASMDLKTEVSVSTPSSTASSSAADLLPETTVPTVSPTSSSNSLSAVPPVHFGKGQKEYAMLRPASENTRKFENWAESFQKSLMSQSKDIEQMLQGFNSNSYVKDRFAEQLDKLKVRSRRDVNAADIILY